MKAIKKIACFCLVIILTAGSVVSGVEATGTTPTVKFEASNATAKKGERVTVSIKMNTTKQSFKICGLQMSLVYDKNQLEFVEAKYDGAVTLLSGAEAYDNKKAQSVKYGWVSSSGDNVTISDEVTVCTLTFKVLSGANEGQSSLKLTVDDAFYYENTEFKNLKTSKKNGSITIDSATNTEVQKTIDAIDAVQTIYDIESIYDNGGSLSTVQEETWSQALQEITTATGLYATLLNSQRQEVTNYQDLLDAQKLYEMLRLMTENEAVAEEIKAYKEANKMALDLTVDTVTTADETIVGNALETINQLSKEAQNALYKDYLHLLRLQDKITLLKGDEAAAEADRKLREQAEEYARIFKEDEFPHALTIQPETVLAVDLEYLQKAMEWIESMSGLNMYVPVVLEAEISHIKNLYQIAQDKAGVNLTDDERAARNFKTNFSYLLGLTEDTVSGNDLTHLEIALGCYGILSSGAQKLLVKEKELLEALKTKAEALYEDELAGMETDYVYIDEDGDGVKEKVIIRYQGMDVAQEINFKSRRLGVFTLILIIACVITTVNFVALLCFYLFYYKKRQQRGDEYRC